MIKSSYRTCWKLKKDLQISYDYYRSGEIKLEQYADMCGKMLDFIHETLIPSITLIMEEVRELRSNLYDTSASRQSELTDEKTSEDFMMKGTE